MPMQHIGLTTLVMVCTLSGRYLRHIKANEDKNQYARWYTACKSPMTYDSWEYGDAYISEIMSVNPTLVNATEEWRQDYDTNK